jgi:hypothetical protein
MYYGSSGGLSFFPNNLMKDYVKYTTKINPENIGL